ncbi:Mov34/MPN/PAD-1 family protein [Stakelama tenebrarum]|uniref:M67 family metallopeptidase n=1 Tax=Stakelama tenebrarum TaxID=2711215 RepID=A0A6G6Y6W8_9SPHN|nr:M67 family metallopeptidase [Sphingosinithalassobacter tenebrarum]QIG80660.1 M67 family metallopeptidase [Sphingosinithalassobacter tenebrarum]
MTVRISRSLLAEIDAACNAAAPCEACGLLFGEARAIMRWQASENVAATPETHFEIDPAALFAAIRAERAGGPTLLGYWHSHPNGDASPSVTDAAMASPDGKLWLIAARGEASLWRAVPDGERHGRFDPVPLAVTQG